jgi:hypothetical protein
MAILNAGLSFDNVGKYATKSTDPHSISDEQKRVRKMFWGTPEVVLFHAGTDLYRLLTPRGMYHGIPEDGHMRDLFFHTGNKDVSEGWFDQEAKTILVRAAHDSGLSIPEVARWGLAVRESWSPSMEDFVWVKLQCEALGLRGATNMRYIDPQLSGPGIPQIWLPNLNAHNDLVVVGKTSTENLFPSLDGLSGGPVLHQP